MKRIFLNGKDSDQFALVDDEDFELLKRHKWYMNSQGYAITVKHVSGKRRGDNGRSKTVTMHRMLICVPKGMVVDHINRDRLDNRRSNLRAASYEENAWNTDRWHIGYLGVSEAGRYSSRWRVRVGDMQYGHYRSAKLAALVYDEVVRQTRGAGCQLNFPDQRLPKDFEIPNLHVLPRYAEKRSSEVGVCWFKPRGVWRYIYKGRTIGYAPTEAEATKIKKQFLGGADALMKRKRKR